MTTPLSQMPKPDAGQYAGKRKLFLVPSFMVGPNAPDEVQQLLDGYWSEVRDHINNLERSLGTVTHVYHEMVFSDGDEGMDLLQMLNPKGCAFIQALCSSGARLEATEDQALVEESADWQRCISVGLVSEKVHKTAVDGYQETTKLRWEHIGTRVDETLKEGESGAIFVREDHRVQFPSDIQVFYVAPPSLDSLKRWLSDQFRPPPQTDEGPAETEEAGEAEESQPPEEAGKSD
ncbi:MAG: hypothetical protein IH956_01195 [Chloroflexi bacterium]|nr:hypothetical protein [Chloroflexota bacterium]